MGIELKQVIKTFHNGGQSFTALNGIHLTIETGEFVAVIGKSGSGKSTLMNMMTGIDPPTSGQVIVAGTEVNRLKQKELAQWRGKTLGVIFQFFQLLPTLTLLENVMLPMDFCSMYAKKERKERACQLLARVGMAEHAHKLPSAVSGGQQQRVAIARALANDPPIIMADEPTGSLDSRTADSVFVLFEELVNQGKTVVMVTHDNDIAHKVRRTVLVADGEIVNRPVMPALPNLDLGQMTQRQPHFHKMAFEPGAVIIREGDEADMAYIITKGEVDVYVNRPNGQAIIVNRLGRGQYFGELALIQGGRRTATICAGAGPVKVMAVDRETFGNMLETSRLTGEEMAGVIRARLREQAQIVEENQ